MSSNLRARGWKTIETSTESGRIKRLADMLASAIANRSEYQLAYVEVYSGLAFLWAEMIVRMLYILHKPVVMALHGGGLVEFSHKHSSRVTNLLNMGKIIVTPSLFLKAGLTPYYSHIRYLPNAVNVSKYRFQLRDNPLPNIIWLRAFHDIYQPKLAVKTISYVMKDFQEIRLTMIGPDKKDGSLTSTLQSARSLGLLSHLNIIGSVPNQDVPGWLAKGDIFLNTTRFESFGVSVVEAALIGLPIVTTDVGELSYLWEHEKTAMLVPPNDAEAMAAAIRRLLTEPRLAEQLSCNARKKAEQFDWSVILPQWEALFEEALDA